MEGVQYATSEDDFRALLCAHGVGELARQVLEPQEKSNVELWVRTAIVTCMPRGNFIPQYIPDTPPGVTLTKLGFDWWYSYTMKDENWEHNVHVQDETSVLLCLSHEGLPKKKYNEVDRQELLMLELFLAFYKRDLYSPP